MGSYTPEGSSSKKSPSAIFLEDGPRRLIIPATSQLALTSNSLAKVPIPVIISLLFTGMVFFWTGLITFSFQSLSRTLLAISISLGIAGLLLSLINLPSLFSRQKISGHILDISDPLLLRLIESYKEIFKIAEGKNQLAQDSLEAAHQAIVEVTDLLNGQAPSNEAEKDYILLRVDAVESLLKSLKDVQSRAVSASLAQAQMGKQQAKVMQAMESMARKQSVDALMKFEERTKISSLVRLEELKTIAKSSTPHLN